MMHHHVTVVLAGAIAHFASGWILNCDMLFGKLWQKDKKEQVECHKNMYEKMAFQFVASLALSLAVCIAIYMMNKAHNAAATQNALSKLASIFFEQGQAPKSLLTSLRVVFFIWAGFIIPTSAGEVIWCAHSLKNWALELSMELVGLVAIAAVVTHLA